MKHALIHKDSKVVLRMLKALIVQWNLSVLLEM